MFTCAYKDNDINYLDISEVENIENDDLEVQWAVITSGPQKTFIGIYYGPQERAPKEEVQREYDTLKSQINSLKQNGKVILAGDFNAKLKVNIPERKINQEMSRNGELLKELIEDTETIPINMDPKVCDWTRENRKKKQEKSVIDYILVTPQTLPNVKEIRVDTAGTHRIKGKEETDHNTILLELNNNINTYNQPRTIWKKATKQQWRKFNSSCQKSIQNEKPENFNQLEKIIIQNLKKEIGQITLKNHRQYESKATKQKRHKKKEMAKKYRYACTNKSPDIEDIKEQYFESQRELRKQKEQDEKERRNKMINTLINEGGTKSQLFWRMRKKIISKDSDASYDTKDEDGNTIKDPEQAKNHIADYYEELYQARQGDPNYENWTTEIKDKIADIQKELSNQDPIPEITEKELTTAIKSLKRNKACGPDCIPNEVFIEANTFLKEEIRKFFNILSKEYRIPDQWQEGEIKRLYKGKGNKGKCSAERGITLSSNFGKLYERVINNRVIDKINISDAQAGGKKGRATVDHLLIIKDLIHHAKKSKKPLYIVFLDVTKAYDKAWLDAIMYVMHKEGLKDNHWTIVRKLNQNLTAKIQTKYGPTRKINIKDSIRQGGVLSVAQYAVLTDEITKEINTSNKGVNLPNKQEKIGSLLWVDDVAIMSCDPSELQNMLDITNETAKKYRIEFSKEKSQVLVIGKQKSNQTEKFRIGDLELEQTKTYKYLGETLNDKGNIDDHLKGIKRKVEAAYQTIRLISGNQDFKGLELETIWKLIETCILPIALYGAETWNNTKKQTTEINRIMDNILKRVLNTPTSTPREPLYMETGMLDIDTHAKKRQLMMKQRLNVTANNLINEMLETTQKGNWKDRIEKLCQEWNIEDQHINSGKITFKKLLERKATTHFKTKLTQESVNKSKVKYLSEGNPNWTPGIRREYLDKLPRHEASIIFKARTRMLKIKGNYKNMYKNNLECRACGQSQETQIHILNECTTLHTNNSTKVTQEQLFTENTTTLKTTLKKIQEIMAKLEETKTQNSSGQPSNIGRRLLADQGIRTMN